MGNLRDIVEIFGTRIVYVRTLHIFVDKLQLLPGNLVDVWCHYCFL